MRFEFATAARILFGAGVFREIWMEIRALGDSVLIIREEGAKMPADLGGNIYLTLTARDDVRPIESAIRDFVERRL